MENFTPANFQLEPWTPMRSPDALPRKTLATTTAKGKSKSKRTYAYQPPFYIQAKIKEQKRLKTEQRLAIQQSTKRDFLQLLPLELLVNILADSSIVTILNVTRCCKWLCNTLTDTKQAHVWKAARQRHLIGPIPDPPWNFPEPAYAARLLDFKKCAQCENLVREPPLFFHSNLVFCPTTTCASPSYIKKHFIPLGLITTPMELHPPPVARANFTPDPLDQNILAVLHIVDGHGLTASVARAEREAALSEWKETEGEENREGREILLKRWAHTAMKMPAYYKHDREYRVWITKWRAVRQQSAKQKVDLLAQLKTDHWKEMTTGTSATLRAITLTSLRENAPLVLSDVEKKQVAAEITAARELHERRQGEHVRELRQKAVEDFWQQLKTGDSSNPVAALMGDSHLVPPLAEFRRLATIRNLEKNPAIGSDLASNLMTGPIRAAFQEDLKKWGKTITRAFTAKLGFKRGWDPEKQKQKNADNKDGQQEDALPPTERLTALFECTRCHRTGRKYAQEGALTLYEVLKHRCPKNTMVAGSNGKMKESREWDMAIFQVDECARKAVTLALQVAGLNEATATMDDVGKKDVEHGKWICTSCPGDGLIMPFDYIPGHAKRHKELHEKASAATASTSTTPASTPGFRFSLRYVDAPPRRGLSASYPKTEVLMSDTPSSVKRRAAKEYGCRYCEITNPRIAPWCLGSNNRKFFTVEGLKGHLLAKHGVTPLRGEDFYHYCSCCAPNNLSSPDSVPNPEEVAEAEAMEEVSS